MASFLVMFREHVKRKCYKSRDKAGLLRISAFSASFTSFYFFKLLLLRKLCYQNKRKFPSNPGSVPHEKNFDFISFHSIALKGAQSINQTHSSEMPPLYINLNSLVTVAAERSAVGTLVYCLARAGSTSTWDCM
jgi:hypothetical protein